MLQVMGSQWRIFKNRTDVISPTFHTAKLLEPSKIIWKFLLKSKEKNWAESENKKDCKNGKQIRDEIDKTNSLFTCEKGWGEELKWLPNLLVKLGSLFIEIWKEEWETSFDKKDIEFNFLFLSYILNNHVKISKTYKWEYVIIV